MLPPDNDWTHWVWKKGKEKKNKTGKQKVNINKSLQRTLGSFSKPQRRCQQGHPEKKGLTRGMVVRIIYKTTR